MKYSVEAVKEVRHFLKFEVEANSLQEAKELVWDLGEKGDGIEVDNDCTDFEILECKQIN